MAEVDFDGAFTALKSAFAPVADKLRVTTDDAARYVVSTQKASPMKQHKGAPMFFGEVRRGKAYVSLHLFPLYMNAPLTASVSPELKKRMQGKTCFNFKAAPSAAQLKELQRLAREGVKDFEKSGWA